MRQCLHASVCSSYGFEFSYMDSSKIADPYFYFLSELSPFVELSQSATLEVRYLNHPAGDVLWVFVEPGNVVP